MKTFKCLVSEATVCLEAKSIANKERLKATLAILGAANVVSIAIWLLMRHLGS